MPASAKSGSVRPTISPRNASVLIANRETTVRSSRGAWARADGGRSRSARSVIASTAMRRPTGRTARLTNQVWRPLASRSSAASARCSQLRRRVCRSAECAGHLEGLGLWLGHRLHVGHGRVLSAGLVMSTDGGGRLIGARSGFSSSTQTLGSTSLKRLSPIAMTSTPKGSTPSVRSTLAAPDRVISLAVTARA
jgi:hypothetical protein